MLFISAQASSDEGQLRIQKITANVYVHTSYQHIKGFGLYPSNGLVYVDPQQRAFIIDTPWSEQDSIKLLSWIKDQGFAATASISTHFHDDRVAGIAEFRRRGLRTYASFTTNALIEAHNGTKAEYGFDPLDFRLADGSLEIDFSGAGHTQDNIVVWLPEPKILVGGCLVKGLESRSLGNIADANLDTWAASINNLMDRYAAAKHVLPGHGAIQGTNLLTHTINLLERNQKQPNMNKSATDHSSINK